MGTSYVIPFSHFSSARVSHADGFVLSCRIEVCLIDPFHRRRRICHHISQKHPQYMHTKCQTIEIFTIYTHLYIIGIYGTYVCVRIRGACVSERICMRVHFSIAMRVCAYAWYIYTYIYIFIFR